MRLVSLLAVVALSLSVPAVVAADSAGSAPVPGTPKLANMSAKEFLAYHDKLDQELKTRKYQHISSSAIDDIGLEQSKIRALVGTHQSLDELSNTDQVSVFNAHERVIAIVEDSEDDRVICKREKVVGSHRPVNVCHTVGELKMAQKNLRTDELALKQRCGSQCAGN